MNLTALRAVVLMLVVAASLTACLSSDAPNLTPADLTTLDGLPGTYRATAFPEDGANAPETVDATVEAIGDRAYRLTFSEGEHKDAPVMLRFVTLNDGGLLAVITDPDPAKGALYARLMRAADASWVLRMVDVREDRRDRKLRDALLRHGATGVDFGSGTLRNDRIAGALSAANLRALFSDFDFQQALETEHGFRLSPLHPKTSGIALE